MKRITIVISAVLGLGLVGCSNETTPTEPGTYVISTAGSYFVHANREFDINDAGVIDTNDLLQDSTVITGAKTVAGRSAVESIMYVGGVPIDTTYDSQQGSVVSTLLPLDFSVFGAPVELGSKWVNLFDENATSWVALRDTVPQFTIDGGPAGSYTGTGGLNFLGKKIGTETVTVGGKSVSTTKVEITLNITLYLDFGVSIVPLPIQLVRTYWFANKIGWVKYSQPAKLINLPGVPALPVDGQERTLVRYSVK